MDDGLALSDMVGMTDRPVNQRRHGRDRCSYTNAPRGHLRIITFLLAAALPASAQVNVLRVPGGFASSFGAGFGDAARVAIGVTTTSSATSRDPLGVLVTSGRPDR